MSLLTVIESYFLFCSGLTHSNYKELNVLYEKYKNQGSSRILIEQHPYF
jgi:hypothetical protein